MDPTTQRLMEGAAGAATEATYVDDVFSTFVYDGTGSEQAINNGIDLSGEGGIAWVKCRSATADHRLIDTDGGANNILTPNNTTAYFNNSTIFSSFNSNGFSVATDVASNGSGRTFVSWSFRKARGFFDVVTYTGNDVAGREISHSLGSVPGMILIKVTNADDSWLVWHRSFPNNGYARLNTTAAAVTTNTQFKFGNGTIAVAPTSTSFTVGNDSDINSSSNTYVAYIFAHDDQSFGTDSDEAIIKCGIYTGNGSNDGPEIDLGFEAQWVMTKAVSQSRGWIIGDVIRGAPVSSGAQDAAKLSANSTDAEILGDEPFVPLSTGFKVRSNSGSINDNGLTYIYVAIRRPNKPPEAATDVFNAVADTGSSSARTITAGNLVDLQFSKSRNNTYNWYWLDRLRGATGLNSNSTSAESTSQVGSTEFDVMDGMSVAAADGWTSASPFGGPYIRYFLTRAPGVFDVVCYDGSGGNQTINHNLTVIPELMIIKARNDGQSWLVYPGDPEEYLILNSSDAQLVYSFFNSTEPTSTQFTIGPTWSATGKNYIAYLFATLDGISKVGTYSGTGNNVDVDCGFSAGARFVLIKRTDSSGGNWFVWDTARGIVSGNDPYLELNTSDAEVTNTDYIDPLNSGFTVTSSAPAEINASGGTYLFLAIA